MRNYCLRTVTLRLITPTCPHLATAAPSPLSHVEIIAIFWLISLSLFKKDIRLRSFLPTTPKGGLLPRVNWPCYWAILFSSKPLTFCGTVLNGLMGNPGLLACTLQSFVQCWNGLFHVLTMCTTPRTTSCDANHNTTMVGCSLQCCIYEVPDPGECLQICGHSLSYFFEGNMYPYWHVI